ncbi:MAG: hypothetical protein GF346_03110 [Candidatus Eisenbacteria bacterium]|nr:hypothetical protein [Candidatus Latescibacterota bacterium]MBD3301410.1 hypothetical protein [Candidatus Eisenbacteria bacterium]
MLAMVPQSLYAGKKMLRLSERDIGAPAPLDRGAVDAHRSGRERTTAQTTPPGSLSEGDGCRNARRPNPLALLPILAGLLLAPLPAHPFEEPGIGEVVIRVGPIDQTAQEFSDSFRYYAGIPYWNLTLDRDGLDRFTGIQVDRMIVQAHAMEDSSYVPPREFYMTTLSIDRILHTALREELLPEYVETEESILREVYDRMGTELRLSTIKLPTLVLLDSVQTALEEGVSFEEAARRWSVDAASAPRGGHLGWVEATRFPVDVQREIWDLREGEVSGPIAEPRFHALYKVHAGRPASGLGSFQDERNGILTSIYHRELAAAARQMQEDLLARYRFRVDEEAVEWLRAFLHEETASARREYDPEKDDAAAALDEEPEGPFWPEAPLEGEEAERIVARIEGDSLTALGVIDELVFRPTLTWPRFESATDVVDLCIRALYYRIQSIEARKRDLHERPEIARQIRNQHRWMHWHAFRIARIRPEVRPTEEELRRIYRDRIERYRLPERRKFVLVAASDRAVAEAARERLLRGALPGEIASALQRPDVEMVVTPDTTTGWVAYGDNPTIDNVIFGLPEGRVSDPVLDRGLHAVVRVEEISPAHTQSFESVEVGLRREIIELRRRDFVADLADSLRDRYPIEIDREAIRAIEIDPDRVGGSVPAPRR